MAHTTEPPPPQVPRLPKNGTDGEQLIDVFGNVYEFNVETKSWLYKGLIQDPDVVTEQKDGLIDGEIHDKLVLIQKLVENGYNFDRFKLFVENNNPYFFYFRSHDRLIKFTISMAKHRQGCEDVDIELRIEVDKGAIIRRFQTCCIGPKGEKGLTGAAGRAGLSGSSEAFRNFSSVGATNSSVSIDATVTTPIETELSIRLFSSETTQAAEIFLTLDNSLSIINSEHEIDLDNTSLVYDVDTGKLTGTIAFVEEIEGLDIWKFKARQRGPKGQDGSDGSPFLEIIDQIVTDTNLRSTQAIVSLRKSDLLNNMFVLKQNMFEKVCAGNLSAISGSQTINAKSILDLTFASVKMTIDNCKDVGKFNISLEDLELPVLDLPNWVPTGACVDYDKHSMTKFNWFDFTEPRYPFRIKIDNRAPVQCCQENFFYCPSVGDQPCPIEGDIVAPELPPSDECTIDCDIEFELQNGGFEFPVIIGSGANDALCVINGIKHQYKQKIVVAGTAEVTIITAPDEDVENPVPYSNTITAELISGAVTIIPSTAISMGIDEEVTMTLEGSGVVGITVFVNDTFVDSCSEYTLDINVTEILPEAPSGGTTGANGSTPPASSDPGIPPPWNPDTPGGGIITPDDPAIDPIDPIDFFGNLLTDEEFFPAPVENLPTNPPKGNQSMDNFLFSGDATIQINTFTEELLVNSRRINIFNAYPGEPGDLIDDNATITVVENSLRFDMSVIGLEVGPFGEGFYMQQLGVAETELDMLNPETLMRTDNFSAGFLFISTDGTEFKLFSPLANSIPLSKPTGSSMIDTLNSTMFAAGDAWIRIDVKSDPVISKNIVERNVFDMELTGLISVLYAIEGVVGDIPIPEPIPPEPAEPKIVKDKDLDLETVPGNIVGGTIIITNTGSASFTGAMTDPGLIHSGLSVAPSTIVSLTPSESATFAFTWTPGNFEVSVIDTIIVTDGSVSMTISVSLEASF